jgi:hypothetical protein
VDIITWNDAGLLLQRALSRLSRSDQLCRPDLGPIYVVVFAACSGLRQVRQPGVHPVPITLSALFGSNPPISVASASSFLYISGNIPEHFFVHKGIFFKGRESGGRCEYVVNTFGGSF